MVQPFDSSSSLIPWPARFMLAGVAFPLIGGKWGSYLGWAEYSLFFSDILMGAGVVLLALTPGRKPRSVRPSSLTVVALAAFCALQITRGEGSLILRLRDLLPYLDLLLVPVLAASLVTVRSPQLLRFLWVTSSVHALWAIPALLGALPPLGSNMAVIGFPLFTPRPDIDVPLVALFLILLLMRPKIPDSVKWVLGALALSAILLQPSRASLAASVALLLVFALLQWRRLRAAVGRATFAFAGFVVVLLLAVTTSPAALLQSGALGRAGIVTSGPSTLQAASGEGTARGRLIAWRLSIEYWEQAGSSVIGVGPGVELVANSGAVQFLSGDPTVRAPHNWWVHAWARFGPLGLLLWLTAALGLGRRSGLGMAATASSTDELLEGCAKALAFGLVLAASVGVLIESPFGGYVLALALSLLRIRPWQPSGRPARRSRAVKPVQRVGSGDARHIQQRTGTVTSRTVG